MASKCFIVIFNGQEPIAIFCLLCVCPCVQHLLSSLFSILEKVEFFLRTETE
jgi:hypothetical protein